MTFLSELARLREAATQCKDIDVSWYHFSDEDYELLVFLRNHAEAIEELVRAAEYVLQDEINLIPRADSRTRAVVAKALQSLNRSE